MLYNEGVPWRGKTPDKKLGRIRNRGGRMATV
jgi:hypothetical protein